MTGRPLTVDEWEMLLNMLTAQGLRVETADRMESRIVLRVPPPHPLITA